MSKIDLFQDAKKQPQGLDELKTALEKYQGLQFYLEAPEEEMSSEWWPLDAVRLLPFDPLGADVGLPSFGGPEPAERQTAQGDRILSWDEGRYLVQVGDELRIIDRG